MSNLISNVDCASEYDIIICVVSSFVSFAKHGHFSHFSSSQRDYSFFSRNGVYMNLTQINIKHFNILLYIICTYNVNRSIIRILLIQ